MKYSDQIGDWLLALGYTHCFYVGGGNIMHLIESLSLRLDCHPVINEVAAGIAAEYFNEASRGGAKALALVTAGPGLTNIMTAIAGAFLESRELLVIGGQVKTADLAHGTLRQRGIQEIDGVSITRPITVESVLLEEPLGMKAFVDLVQASRHGRKGPVFIEIPLDVQARQVEPVTADEAAITPRPLPHITDQVLAEVADRIRHATRPVLLLGGGIDRATAAGLWVRFGELGIPLATTWNAADRIDADHPVYVGRPNTWGQRSANIVLQQADLLVALGSRLGMQQTGFNWHQFVPSGEVIQVDLDRTELEKGHPRIAQGLCIDANDMLARLARMELGDHAEWLAYARHVRDTLPTVEAINNTADGYISPYCFVEHISTLCHPQDTIIPCSSGGAFTVMMQAFRQKAGQIMITNKGLASMGYGLSGAIGAAFANPDGRVVLVEGDGGFAQNLQEIGTARINGLNLKIFLFDDGGYASIRATQRNYFKGRYVGCDRSTGLGLPDWEKLFAAWSVPVMTLEASNMGCAEFSASFNQPGMAAFVVKLDPDQTYFPKITSRITDSGTMESNPLHLMTPELDADIFDSVLRYLPKQGGEIP
ncbi:thiamine pyrophosphate-binding protein [Thermomonas sp. RSS23]|uniref:Thiamine pyrophosphate-binding protein n=1 Tax=Thermomonas beijingensis TaxID=2872701 RepID=A0ABS7TAR4_9GAMM|nr:thiamine pyrophosphate-binding protein [Thermomonas beijingensis]MBZ4184942.1 thiamine pyrophosphate-binding protein [Thermomonas beijingensis]